MANRYLETVLEYLNAYGHKFKTEAEFWTAFNDAGRLKAKGVRYIHHAVTLEAAHIIQRRVRPNKGVAGWIARMKERFGVTRNALTGEEEGVIPHEVLMPPPRNGNPLKKFILRARGMAWGYYCYLTDTKGWKKNRIHDPEIRHYQSQDFTLKEFMEWPAHDLRAPFMREG